tara:strand:- start:165 stop:383 length:219 start_codon:yes stop_codon:yes gene_type:complete
MTKNKVNANDALDVGKDGYSKGGKSIPIPSQNLHIDPRGETSFRGKGVYVAQGDEVEVKGTGKARKQHAKWF